MLKKIKYQQGLPIFALKDTIIEHIQKYPVIIIAGETGSGKTTQLPKMCIEAGLGNKKMIACTQPRRIAATSVAMRVSEELSENAEIVGYKIRFKDKTNRSTRIKFVTDGILLSEASGDKLLNDYDTIIIDEAHERSLNIDFLLGILKKIQNKRPELKIIVSSATLDTEAFSKFFNNAPVLKIPGKTYPVEVQYLPNEINEVENDNLTNVIFAVKKILKSHTGDVLIFMATERDIVDAVDAINVLAKKISTKMPGDGVAVLPLYGRLSINEQGKIFKPTNKRKIIVATNVAETSITVPGIRFVIDSGQARISSYNPRARTTKLPIVAISRASADQRKGRCGRVGPGVCVRLYSEDNYIARPDFTPPEIVRSNLAEVILKMISLKLGYPGDFPFIEKPSPRSISDGFNLLIELGAIKKQGQREFILTQQGLLMSKLPLDPCISSMVLEGKKRNVLHEIIIIAAALSIRDPRVRPSGSEKIAQAAHQKFIDKSSDFISFLNIWQKYHSTAEKVKSNSKLRKFCKQNFLSYQRMREWSDISDQIRFALRLKKQSSFNIEMKQDIDQIHKSILRGLLRNIGLKKHKNIYNAAFAKELMVFPGSGIFDKAGQWIMAAELVETSRLYARCAANIDCRWIESIAGDLCRHSYSSPHWEKKKGQVIAFQKVNLFGLVIIADRKINFGPKDPEMAREIFIQDGLIEGQMPYGFKFLAKNNQLIERLRELENRLRSKVVVDENKIFDFYNQKIPDDVWDIATLKRKLPQHNHTLIMTENDILLQSPKKEQLFQFPEQIKIDTFNLDLSYTFCPGDYDDGVTVSINVDILDNINPTIFEWLVPGLIAEKVIFLIRGLPKRIRKHLIPINNTANKAVEEIPFGNGSLYHQLEKHIYKIYKIKITQADWPKDSLPKHLMMRYCIVNANGKHLKKSRSFNSLFKNKPVQSENNNKVDIRLFEDESKAQEANIAGLMALYNKKIRPLIKQCTKNYLFKDAEWHLYEAFGTKKNVNADVQYYILKNIYNIKDGFNPAEKKFSDHINSFKDDEIIKQYQSLFNSVLKIFIERKNTVDLIKNYELKAYNAPINNERFKHYQNQLVTIVPLDFLKIYEEGRTKFINKHLAALRLRVERAHASPTRDSEKWKIVEPFESFYLQSENMIGELLIPSQKKAVRDVLDEFQIMLEEFKVSIFAPELKTAIPVSTKRLNLKIKEISQIL